LVIAGHPILLLDNAAIPAPVAWPATTTAYTVQVTDPSGCIVSQAVPVHVSLCLNVAALNLRTFIEGFKNGAGTMRAVLFDNGHECKSHRPATPLPFHCVAPLVRMQLHIPKNVELIYYTGM
jgi:hypothetical protein